MIEAAVSFLAFFMMFGSYGIPASSLFSTANTYWKVGAPNFVVK